MNAETPPGRATAASSTVSVASASPDGYQPPRSGGTCSGPPGATRFQPGSVRSARSEEHTSELQSLMRTSYDVFCLKKKRTTKDENSTQRPSKNSANTTKSV